MADRDRVRVGGNNAIQHRGGQASRLAELLVMARIVHSESGPMLPDPSKEPGSNDAVPIYELEIIDWIQGERYDEIIVRFPGREVQRLLRYHHPRTNAEQHKTDAAEKILGKLGPIEHSNKERKHQRRETRARGNKLRAGVQRRDEASRKGS